MRVCVCVCECGCVAVLVWVCVRAHVCGCVCVWLWMCGVCVCVGVAVEVRGQAFGVTSLFTVNSGNLTGSPGLHTSCFSLLSRLIDLFVYIQVKIALSGSLREGRVARTYQTWNKDREADRADSGIRS